LHPVKNCGELILAIGDLAKEGLSVTLEIAGDGAEREKLERMIKDNGLSKHVKLLGWVKDLAKMRGNWDVYVQPSLTEGFGLAVVEAMLAGLPVVVTPGGALPELVTDGETGIVTAGFGHQELAKAIEKLITEPGKMNKIAENGQKHATENFGIEKWAKDTLEAYKKAAK
jgi:glycosyltransferase involved in cell wall biosynthesis